MEKSILTVIADNPSLLKAVRDVIEKQFDVTTRNLLGIASATPNEIIGQKVRAQIDGMKALNDAFIEIETYKTIEKEPEKINRAR